MRILELYLNVIEWGDGVYGCQAAAQRYYGKPAVGAGRERGRGPRGHDPEPAAHQPARVRRPPRARAAARALADGARGLPEHVGPGRRAAAARAGRGRGSAADRARGARASPSRRRPSRRRRCRRTSRPCRRRRPRPPCLRPPRGSIVRDGEPRARTRTSRPRRTRYALRFRGAVGALVPGACRRARRSSCWRRSRARACSTSAAATASSRARSRTPATRSRCTAAMNGCRDARGRPGRGRAGPLRVGRPAARAVCRTARSTSCCRSACCRTSAAWQALVGELCRLAARAVVVDYPTRRSVNAFAGAALRREEGRRGRHAAVRGLLRRARSRTRSPRTASASPRAGRSSCCRWRSTARTAAAASARALEAVPRALRLTQALGSPVILRAERHG